MMTSPDGPMEISLINFITIKNFSSATLRSNWMADINLGHPLQAYEEVPRYWQSTIEHFLTLGETSLSNTGAPSIRVLPTKKPTKKQKSKKTGKVTYKWADSTREFRGGKGYTTKTEREVYLDSLNNAHRYTSAQRLELLRRANARAKTGKNYRITEAKKNPEKIYKSHDGRTYRYNTKGGRVFVEKSEASQNTNTTTYDSSYSGGTTYISGRMPKRRVFRGRRRTYRRRYGMKRMGRAKRGYGAANGLWNARYGHKQEVKFVDTRIDVAGAAAIDDVFNNRAVNVLQQGTGFSQRIGNTVRWIKISWNIYIEDSTNLENIHRFMIFIDKQPNGVLATDADLFQYPVSTSPLQCIASPLNLNNKMRFVVIRDKRIETQDVNRPAVYWKGTARFNFNSQYSTNAGTIADISSYAICFGWISLYAVAQSAGNQVSGYVRCRFTD